ncbi:hypothetical protein BGZ98_006595, partial [Dissophora globulifera]
RLPCEEYTSKLDITQLATDARVVFGGTDYGICTTVTTIAQTQAEMIMHLNRYRALQDNEEMPQWAGTAAYQVPKPFRITAPQINQVTQSRKAARRREYRLRDPANRNVKEAIESLSRASLRTATTFKDIDVAQSVRRQIGPVLRDFETSNRRLKDVHN